MTPAIKLLERLGIDYRLFEYSPGKDGDLGQAAARALGLESSVVYKTLVAQLSDEQLVIAVVPANGKLNLKQLARAAGVKSAKLADPVLAERCTGYLMGGICPLAQKRLLPTFVAEQALALEKIYVSAGKRGLELELRSADLIRSVTATVCALT